MRWMVVVLLLLSIIAPVSAETVGFWSCVGRTCSWKQIDTTPSNGTGEPGAADGNNYCSVIGFSGTTTKTLTLSRVGLGDLTADFTDIDTFNTSEQMRAAVNHSGYYNITVNASNVLNVPWVTSAQVPTYETDAAHDSCAEISGCVVGAITDGNTGWANEYGLLTTETDTIALAALSTTGNFSENASTWPSCGVGEVSKWTGSVLSCVTDALGGGGGFSANQSLNTSDKVRFAEVNITAESGDANLRMNASNLAWIPLSLQDSGANLKLIDSDGTVICTANKNSDSWVCTNFGGTSSYNGAVAGTFTGASGQTADVVQVKNSSGSVHVSVNGSGVLNASKGLCLGTDACRTTWPTSSGSSSWKNITNVDQHVYGTTLANITSLAWPAAANTNYTFDCTIFYRSNLTTNGISFALEDWGGTVNRFRMGVEIHTVAAATVNSGTANVTATKVTSTAVTAANTVYRASLNGLVVNNGAHVTITPQFSAEIAGSNSTIVRDSFCVVSS